MARTSRLRRRELNYAYAVLIDMKVGLRREVEDKLDRLNLLTKYAKRPEAPQNVRIWHEENRDRLRAISDDYVGALDKIGDPTYVLLWAGLNDRIQEVLDHFYSQFLPPALNDLLDAPVSQS